jgi:hypothetical protein
MKSKEGASSKSMRSIVAACLIPQPEEIILPQYDSIDKRSAVNRNNKARVIVIRPKWITWSAEFTLLVHEESITPAAIEQLFKYAGHYVGIGSFRPSNNGMFGRFESDSIINN